VTVFRNCCRCAATVSRLAADHRGCEPQRRSLSECGAAPNWPRYAAPRAAPARFRNRQVRDSNRAPSAAVTRIMVRRTG
jgi:hypothetical protein